MKKEVYVFLIILGVALIIGVVLWSIFFVPKPENQLPQTTAAAAASPKPERPSVIRIEKEITADTIREGLQDVGKLVTEEYFFTEVVNYASVKKLWNINLGFTNSNFLISYDGLVTAGIDLSDVRVEKNDDRKSVYVLLPDAEILGVEIDFDSFQVYSEKEGIGNPISLENYNDALKAIDESARQKAMEKGILDKAYENADFIVRKLVGSLVDLNEYSLSIGRIYT